MKLAILYFYLATLHSKRAQEMSIDTWSQPLLQLS